MSEKPAKHDDSSQPTFEQELAALEAIVHDLEEGRLGLEECLGRYEQGVSLLRRCTELLARAERRIELVRGVDAEGNPITTPLEDESGTLQEKAARRSRRRSTTENLPSSDDRGSDDGGLHVDDSTLLF